MENVTCMYTYSFSRVVSYFLVYHVIFFIYYRLICFGLLHAFATLYVVMDDDTHRVCVVQNAYFD